jgi:hypothetical protein
VCRLNRDNHALHEPALCSATAEGVEVSLALQWASDTFSDTMVGFANSIKTIDGGSHMEGLRAALTRLINSLAKKNKVRGACGMFGCRVSTAQLGTEPALRSMYVAVLLVYHRTSACCTMHAQLLRAAAAAMRLPVLVRPLMPLSIASAF